MIAGSKGRFAIEAEPLETIEGWILGRFRFWICGEPVGNWEDCADLRGWVRWLRDFALNPRDRFEPSLLSASSEEVWAAVYEPTMYSGSARTEIVRTPIDGAYERFFVSYLGMSSMENYDILLMHDKQGGERVIWRSADSPLLHDCRLWRLELENVAMQFCEVFEREVGKQ